MLFRYETSQPASSFASVDTNQMNKTLQWLIQTAPCDAQDYLAI